MGKPSIRIDRRPDPEPPAMATRQVYSFSLEITIDRHSAAGVHAVIRELDKMFSRSEGILRLEDETGFVREWLVSMRSGKPNDALRGNGNVYSVEMTATVAMSANEQMSHGITFLPSGGSMIHLHAVRDLNESIATERHHPRKPARLISTTQISFIARVAYADQSLTHQQRMQQLQTLCNQYRALNCRDGILSMPGMSKLVEVTEWRPIIDERREYLEISVQCRRYDIPGEQQCEATITRRKSEDSATGETMITVSGSIIAEDRETALARMNAIKVEGMRNGTKLVKFDHTMPSAIGEDTDYLEAWGGSIEFQMEYRSSSDQVIAFELRISSEQDVSNGSYRRSYSGFVSAKTLQEAETKARQLGWGKHPYWTRNSEVISYESQTELQGEENNTPVVSTAFVRLEFTYEYDLIEDFLEAEFTLTRNLPSYGDRIASISGSFAVENENTADQIQKKLITSLIPNSEGLSAQELEGRTQGLQIQETKRVKKFNQGMQVKLTRRSIDFSVRIFNRGDECHIKYSRSENINYITLTREISASGTIWADNEQVAKSELAKLKDELQIEKIISEKTQKEIEKYSKSPNETMVGFSFELSGNSDAGGDTGVDITEAQWSLSRTGQINHAILTEIPRNNPVAQIDMGWTIGRMSLTGSVKARSQNTAKKWAQELISMLLEVNGTAYETTPPEETITPNFLPGSTDVVTTWTFQFQYSRSYTNGLEETWKP